MQRYIFFIGTLTQGGAERVVSILTKYFVNSGKDAEIVLYHDKEIFYDVDEKVKITVVKKQTGTSNPIKNILWLRKYFKNNAEAVISFLAPYNIFALAATAFSKQTVIVADRNDPRHIPSNFAVRKLRDFLYRFAKGVVVQTSFNKAYFSKTVRKKSTVIFNPVDIGEKKALALRTEKKKKIVSVGRLMPQKNQIMLFEAFAEIHRLFPEYTLTVYGEGEYREVLESKIKELGMQEFIFLPGSQKDLFDSISDAELFVLSSDYEGMSNALIEALCLGLPVVSTRVSGAEDVITDGENGLLCDVGNKTQLVDAIKKVLENKELRDKMSENAVNLCEKLTPEKILSEWEEYILQVSQKR